MFIPMISEVDFGGRTREALIVSARDMDKKERRYYGNA